MTTVYCLFNVILDGDGYPHWNFISVSRDIPALQSIVAEHLKDFHRSKIIPFAPGMTAENNYTVIGNTKDVHAEKEHCYGDVTGFVIQPESLL